MSEQSEVDAVDEAAVVATSASTSRAIDELREEAGQEWGEAASRVTSGLRRAYRRSRSLPTDQEWLTVSEHLTTALVARAATTVPGVRAEDVSWTRPTEVAGGRVTVELVGRFDMDLLGSTDAVRGQVETVVVDTLGPGWEVDLTWVDLEDAPER